MFYFLTFIIFPRAFQVALKSESESLSAVSDSLRPHGLYSPWNSPGQNTRVGSLSLLQGIVPTQEWNPGLLHCRWSLYQLSYQGSPKGANGKKKNLPSNAGDARDVGSILVSRSSPRVGNGKSLQYACLENSMNRGAWQATVHGATKSQTWLSDCMCATFWSLYMYFTGGRVARDWVKSEHELQLYKQGFACTQRTAFVCKNQVLLRRRGFPISEL